MKKILFIIALLIVPCFSFAKDRDLPGIDLITREEWGADESWLLADNEGYDAYLESVEKYNEEVEWLKKNNPAKYEKIQEDIKKEETRVDYLYEEYEDELHIDKKKTTLDGQILWWDLLYHYEKTRIIIHHTATVQSKYSTQEEFQEHMLWMYKFHAFERGWGDIGYNFIIDPWGNVYEGRAGGEGIVGAHVKYNNTSSLGIVLAGNFEVEEPTEDQIQSLIKLGSVLSAKYNINPYDLVDYHRKDLSNKYPYIEDLSNVSVVGHNDAGHTACPGKYLYARLSEIRREIYKEAKLVVFDDGGDDDVKEEKKLSLIEKIKLELKKRKDLYVSSHSFKNASNLTEKISYHIEQNEISELEKKPVKVLLYELSTNFNKWDVSFQGNMELISGSKSTIKDFEDESTVKISSQNGKFIYNGISYDKIIINSSNIVVENYNRKSYAGLPLNVFEGKLIFLQDKVKISGNYVETSALINELSFFRYLRGIGEVGDNQPYQKIKAISLLVKGYIIFYIEKKNEHPSIPEDSYYNSIDDPRFFQKFVGKGFEKVGTKWQKAVKETTGRYVIYNEELAFTPYFSCSAGFTFSAKEKWGWTDTPYLLSRFDFEKCEDFSGHGVGLSGKGAEWLANRGVNYTSIIRWYFPGANVVNVRAR